jgi:hypothetical protein
MDKLNDCSIVQIGATQRCELRSIAMVLNPQILAWARGSTTLSVDEAAHETWFKMIRTIEKDQLRLRIPSPPCGLPVLKGLPTASLFDLVVGKGLCLYPGMKAFARRNTTAS